MAALGKVAADAPDGVVPVTIEVGFGPLRLELLKKDGRVSRVAMEQGKPEWTPPVTGDDVKGQIAAALGVPYDALHPDLPPQAVGTGNTFLMVPLASVAAVSAAARRHADAEPRREGALGPRPLLLRVRRVAAGSAPESADVRAGRGRAGGPGDGLGGGARRRLPRAPRRAAGRREDGRGRFTIDQGVEMGRPSELDVTVLLEGSVARRASASRAARSS